MLANEPSLGMFRLQEHVRRTLPVLIEVKVSIVLTVIAFIITSIFLNLTSRMDYQVFF